jgi:S-adenosylmethionine:tRNA ribosyltransferase-isomerase
MSATMTARRPIAARPAPPAERDSTRIVLVDPSSDAIGEIRASELPSALDPGDLVVLNDAATIPGALFGLTRRGEPVEVRLSSHAGAPATYWAVVFGRGDWRTKTEDRPAPPSLAAGDRVWLGGGHEIEVVAVSAVSQRLVEVRVAEAAIYAVGRPIQYSYLARDLELGEVQTAYASRPWAFEMPSAGRPLTIATILELERRGVRVRAITHAAGLSATGDRDLDAMLPFPERYDIPEATVRAIESAQGRVIAVGTTVVRALEGCVRNHGRLIPGEGVTDLVIGCGFTLEVTRGVLSGIHEPSESHHRLLEAFAPRPVLERAIDHARARGLMNHEFGDGMLITRQ